MHGIEKSFPGRSVRQVFLNQPDVGVRDAQWSLCLELQFRAVSELLYEHVLVCGHALSAPLQPGSLSRLPSPLLAITSGVLLLCTEAVLLPHSLLLSQHREVTKENFLPHAANSLLFRSQMGQGPKNLPFHSAPLSDSPLGINPVFAFIMLFPPKKSYLERKEG